MYYEQCTLNITLFAKLKCLPMCITSLLAKLSVHQIYCVYSITPTVVLPVHLLTSMFTPSHKYRNHIVKINGQTIIIDIAI